MESKKQHHCAHCGGTYWGTIDGLAKRIDRLKNIALKPLSHHKGYWTKERLIASAKPYKTKAEWKEHDARGYHAAANKKGMMDECSQHMKTYGGISKPIRVIAPDRDKDVDWLKGM